MTWMANLGAETRRTELTARLHRAVLSQLASATPSPPSHMLFFPSNNQHLSPEHFPCSPTTNVFSIPHTYSSLAPLVYGSHPRPMSSLALFPPLPPIHKDRETRQLRKKSHPLQEGRMELVDMASFPDGKV